MPKKKIVLHLPPMWDELYERAALKVPEHADWELKRVVLDVEKTGLAGEAYESAYTYSQQGDLPLLWLPVAHCAENIEEQNLAIVGPAVRTRDDVFVFRRRCRPDGNPLFMIAVREKELTTSNISRVVLHHWSPDTYFFANCENEGHTHEGFNLQRYKHVTEASPEERLRKVARKEYDAAIFMGNEIDQVKPFDDEDVIAAANLNQMICNLYNCKLFPRAVLAVFKSDIENEWKSRTLREFVDIFNEIAQRSQRPRPARIANVARRAGKTQFLCPTGQQAQMDDVRTLIRFTRDMLHDALAYDRSPNRKTRALKDSDFIWWEDIVYKQRMEKLVEYLNSGNVEEIFRRAAVDPSAKEIDVRQKGVELLVDEAMDGMNKDGPSFKLENFLLLVRRLKLHGDDREILATFIQDLWKKI